MIAAAFMPGGEPIAGRLLDLTPSGWFDAFVAQRKAVVSGLMAWLLAACGDSARIPDRLPIGTWGGDEAGMVVSAEGAHVHVRCTVGDVEPPIALDPQGRFDAPGRHNVDAFPVNRGIFHPARYSGSTDGRNLVLTVRLTDTGQTLGPVGLVLGLEPRMVNCPICRR
jgi:hypothetical protein